MKTKLVKCWPLAWLVLLVGLGFYLTQTVNDLQNTVAAAKANAAKTCDATVAARIDSNRHVRLPLRSVAKELGSLLEQAAAHQPDKDKRAKTLALAVTFERYAAEVKDIPVGCRSSP